REYLLKDKYFGDLLALEHHTVDRAAAFELWKATRQRLDLAYASVAADPFRERTEREEATRSAIAAQADVLKKLGDAGRDLRRAKTLLDKWHDANKSWPADSKELLEKEPGKRDFGGKLENDP